MSTIKFSGLQPSPSVKQPAEKSIRTAGKQDLVNTLSHDQLSFSASHKPPSQAASSVTPSEPKFAEPKFGTLYEKTLGLMLKANDWMVKTEKSHELETINHTVDLINAYDEDMSQLSNEDFQQKTQAFREKLDAVPVTGGEKVDRANEEKVLQEILPEAFALVKEAAWRILEMKHYDVQNMAGILLNKGQVIEMKTGEGKTLAATTAAYLNALSGKGVHIMTPNDYLAARDAEKMQPLFDLLGLSVGAIVEADRENPEAKKKAYNADITYCNATEFGFDYLRDNLANNVNDLVQRPFNFAIVDEADHVLIDVAKNPLILSGGEAVSSKADEKHIRDVQAIVKTFEEGVDYEIDHQKNYIGLIDPPNEFDMGVGEEKLCTALGIDSLYKTLSTGKPMIAYVRQALKANFMMEAGVDYEVKDHLDKQLNKVRPQVLIVNESTGRLQIGSNWSEGLHQAVEAKHGLPITPERKTLATVTYQNLFKMFPKLSGMTGTAMTAEQEFVKVYEMPPVTEIPTHKPNLRVDMNDQIFINETFKYHRVVESIFKLHQAGRPVLVGTASVEASEHLSKLLTDSSEMKQFVQEFSDISLQEADERIKNDDPLLVEVLTKLSEDATSVEPKVLKQLAETYQDLSSKLHIGPIARFDKDTNHKKVLDIWVKDLIQLATTVETIQAIDNGELMQHSVLNAKQDKNEADIVGQAGRLNAITIATNMAGRGTDIKLGGDPEQLTEMQFIAEGRNLDTISDAEFEARLNKNKIICKAEKKKVIELGGLHVIGTERYDDRRIDNQLRGRSGRQGDPGSSQFFVSFEDDIVRETKELGKLLLGFNDYDNQPYAMEHRLASKVINNAQNHKQLTLLEHRKNELDYDNTYQEQRVVWYNMRRELLGASNEEILADLNDITQRVAKNVIKNHVGDLGDKLDKQEAQKLASELNQQFPVVLSVSAEQLAGKKGGDIAKTLANTLHQTFLKNVEGDEERLASVTKQVLLTDLMVNQWQAHLKELDILKTGIGKRAIAQRDPKVEFQQEAYHMFTDLKERVQESLIRTLLGVSVKSRTLA